MDDLAKNLFLAQASLIERSWPKGWEVRSGVEGLSLAPLDPVPETEQALADVREFMELSTQLGVELISGLTDGPYHGCPWLRVEVVTVAAEGADKRILRLKLADHFHGALIALRAIEAKRHISH